MPHLHGTMNRPRPPRLLLLGWDAATWDVARPWVESGKLPHLARLMQRGAHGTMTSTPVPISPAAWSSIITGQNPGKHGVFDWFQAKPNSYDVEYVHTGRIASRPMWSYFNDAGWRIGVINLPMLYPAVPLDGVMLSGLAAPNPHATGFSYPAELVREIEGALGDFPLGYTEVYKYGREQHYLDGMLAKIEYQRKLLHHLLTYHPCDCYIVTFMQTDHIQHKFWRYYDPQHPLHNPERDRDFQDGIFLVYQALDRVLGEMVARCGNDTTYAVFSDHGANGSYGTLYVNRWLYEQGYLHLKNTPRTHAKYWLARSNVILQSYRALAGVGLGGVARFVPKPMRARAVKSFLSLHDIDWTRTKAYATGMFGQITINVQGRQPQGIVAPGAEYEQLMTDIMSGLPQIREPTSDAPLITDLYRREERFHGPLVNQIADILFGMRDYHYDTTERLGVENPHLFGESEYGNTGCHHPDGMLVLAGPGVQPGATINAANVVDFLPTVLALAGIAVPDDMDGAPLWDALTDEVHQRSTTQQPPTAASASDTANAPTMSAAEQAQLEERLRNLGYIS